MHLVRLEADELTHSALVEAMMRGGLEAWEAVISFCKCDRGSLGRLDFLVAPPPPPEPEGTPETTPEWTLD